MALISGACQAPARTGGEAAGHVGPEIPTTVQFDLADRTTSFGERTVRVLVRRGDAPVDEKLVAEVAAATQLRTWPELAPLPSRIEILDQAASNAERLNLREPPHRGGRVVRISWEQLAKSQWYAVTVDRLPAEARASERGSARQLQGRLLTRFTEDATPVLAGIELHEKLGDKPATLVVDFSEPVQALATATDPIAVSDERGNRVSCAGDWRSWPPGSAAARLFLRCEGELPRAGLTFALGEGLAGRSGTTALPVRLAVPAQGLEACGPTCKRYRPD